MLVNAWNDKAKRLEVLGGMLRTKDLKEERQTEAAKLRELLRDISSLNPLLDEAKLLVSRGAGSSGLRFTGVPMLADKHRRDVAAAQIQSAWRGQRRVWCSIPARWQLMQPQEPPPRARPTSPEAPPPPRPITPEPPNIDDEAPAVSASPSGHHRAHAKAYQIHHRRASARARRGDAYS